MAYELRDMSGSAFPNKKKTDERHPNVTGRCMIAGVTYWLSGWVKQTQSGEKWMSFSFKPVDETEQRHPPESSQEVPNDGIPF